MCLRAVAVCVFVAGASPVVLASPASPASPVPPERAAWPEAAVIAHDNGVRAALRGDQPAAVAAFTALRQACPGCTLRRAQVAPVVWDAWVAALLGTPGVHRDLALEPVLVGRPEMPAPLELLVVPEPIAPPPPSARDGANDVEIGLHTGAGLPTGADAGVFGLGVAGGVGFDLDVGVRGAFVFRGAALRLRPGPEGRNALTGVFALGGSYAIYEGGAGRVRLLATVGGARLMTGDALARAALALRPEVEWKLPVSWADGQVGLAVSVADVMLLSPEGGSHLPTLFAGVVVRPRGRTEQPWTPGAPVGRRRPRP